MGKRMGIWIDHRQAVLVKLTQDGEVITHIVSKIGSNPRSSGGARSGTYGPMDVNPEDQRDRQYNGHLRKYYDEVAAHFVEAESIFILGPGEGRVIE